MNSCDLSQRRRPFLSISPSWCILCKLHFESNNHLLLHCQFARSMWDRVFMEFGVIGALPLLWYDFLCVDWCLRGKRKLNFSGEDVVWQLFSTSGWSVTLEFLKIVLQRLWKFGARSNFQHLYGLSFLVYLGLWPFLIFFATGTQLCFRLISFCVAVCVSCLALLSCLWWIPDPPGCTLCLFSFLPF